MQTILTKLQADLDIVQASIQRLEKWLRSSPDDTEWKEDLLSYKGEREGLRRAIKIVERG